MIELILVKKLMLLKVITVKNVWFATISFLIMGFQDYVCNLSDVAIITVKNVNYCCVIHEIANLMQFTGKFCA